MPASATSPRRAASWAARSPRITATKAMRKLIAELGLGPDDGIFFAAGKEAQAAKLAGAARTRVGEQLGLIGEDEFRFCWIVDFPMFEYDEDAKKVDFSHNPFSMPQGELEALETKDPLDILAFQYDIVCNGVELSSGAIRNHRPDIMYKAFEIAGYSQEDVDANFSGMINAFKYGAPASRRLGAGHRPDRHAARRRAQHPRGRPLPDEPARRGSDDGRARAWSAPSSCASSTSAWSSRLGRRRRTRRRRWRRSDPSPRRKPGPRGTRRDSVSRSRLSPG